MSKTLHIAYICWLIGGLFGLHHAYLRKDKHALIYFSTLGGFLICWLVDVFRIPSYVREANRDDYYTAKLESTKNQLKAPSFHGFRFFGSILVGVFYSFIIKYTLTTEHIFFIVLFKIISACIIALLIYLVGTEEPMQCEFKWPLLGSLVGVLLPESLSIYGCPILSALFLNWNVFWSDEISLAKQQDRKLFKRLAIFSIYSFVLVLLISLFVWNNTTIEMNGKKVNLKDAVYEFWNSKEMEKTCEILRIAWNFYRAHGLRKLIDVHFYGIDTGALENAYKVIEMSPNSSQNDVHLKCKTLARKWHPDKFKDDSMKQEAQQKFIAIQAACNLISEKNINKIKHNQRPTDEY